MFFVTQFSTTRFSDSSNNGTNLSTNALNNNVNDRSPRQLCHRAWDTLDLFALFGKQDDQSQYTGPHV